MQLESPVSAFKNRIGFAEAPPADLASVVVLDWGQVVGAVDLGGWTPDGDDVAIGPDGAARFFAFANEGGRFKLDVYAMDSAAESRQFLVDLASRTMMPQIPFGEGPELGDLSCQVPPDEEGGHVIWSRGNVCVSAQVEFASPTELERWCREIDNAMVASTVSRAESESKAIRISDLVATPSSATPETLVAIRWSASEGEYIVSRAQVVEPAGQDAVEILEQRAGAVDLRPKAPGKLVVCVSSTDTRWLVPSSESIEIDVKN